MAGNKAKLHLRAIIQAHDRGASSYRLSEFIRTEDITFAVNSEISLNSPLFGEKKETMTSDHFFILLPECMN